MKLIMQEIIKDLRKEKGISSTTALEKEIEPYAKKYGITISSSTLNDLEETDDSSTSKKSRKNKNFGYKIFLALADYYGVSVDYIFGRTDTRSPDPDMRAFKEYTGLTENAIERLKIQCEKARTTDDNSYNLVSVFLSAMSFYDIIDHTYKCSVSSSIISPLKLISEYLNSFLSKQSIEMKASKEAASIVAAFKEFVGKYTESFYLYNLFEFYPTVAIKKTLENAENYMNFQKYTASQLLEDIIRSVKDRPSELKETVDFFEEYIEIIETKKDISQELKKKLSDDLMAIAKGEND